MIPPVALLTGSPGVGGCRRAAPPLFSLGLKGRCCPFFRAAYAAKRGKRTVCFIFRQHNTGNIYIMQAGMRQIRRARAAVSAIWRITDRSIRRGRWLDEPSWRLITAPSHGCGGCAAVRYRQSAAPLPSWARIAGPARVSLGPARELE